jgi:branched-chain amino acid transport system ATP-binding protein
MMLTAVNVVKDFDGLRALDGVSISVPAGKIVGLIGPNGSGKSTLINILSGMTPPTSGSIHFDGHEITRAKSDEIFHRGLVRGFQDPSLFFQMTVLDNTLLPAKHQRGEQPLYAPLKRTWNAQEQSHAAKAGGILASLALRKHVKTPASDLSGGQMKLAEIARCLMGEPKMLLLDEPTAGVTPSLAYTIFEQIETLRRDLGISFLIVEHRLDILFDFVDSVYVMHLGKMIAEGAPDEITRNTQVREVYLGD